MREEFEGSMLIDLVNIVYKIVYLRGRLGRMREEFVGSLLVVRVDVWYQIDILWG